MSSQTNKFKGLFMTFLMIVIGLALTPSVASFGTDALYQETIQTIAFGAEETASSGNITLTTTYEVRTDGTITSTLYLNTTNATTTPTGYDVTGTKEITIYGMSPTDGDYWGTVTYETDDLTETAVTALAPLASLLYVVVVLAVGISAIYVQLKFQR